MMLANFQKNKSSEENEQPDKTGGLRNKEPYKQPSSENCETTTKSFGKRFRTIKTVVPTRDKKTMRKYKKGSSYYHYFVKLYEKEPT